MIFYIISYKQKNVNRDSNQKLHHILDINQKGSNIMRIAVTYENGQIFRHFASNIFRNENSSSSAVDRALS